MKYFYISSMAGISGICKYSKDFYELVLKKRGYIFMDSRENLSTIFTKISSRDHVHIEIGIFQKREIEILFLMLKAKYKNVSITLHDPPLLKYPLKDFENDLLSKVSKFYDRFIIKFRNARPYVEKIKSIYVLSKKGVSVAKKIYNTNNIYFLPHIINPAEIEETGVLNKNFLYFGFIGKNKGIEYSLKLHRDIIQIHPDVKYYVIGTALGNEQGYYSYLKEKYTNNVHFLGYVPEQDLFQLYKKASFAMTMFKEYNFFHPISGSILYSLKKGKIVLTNEVNSVSEIVTDLKNGIYLSGNLKKDVQLIMDLYNDTALLQKIQKNIYYYLSEQHAPETVDAYFEKKVFADLN